MNNEGQAKDKQNIREKLAIDKQSISERLVKNLRRTS